MYIDICCDYYISTSVWSLRTKGSCAGLRIGRSLSRISIQGMFGWAARVVGQHEPTLQRLKKRSEVNSTGSCDTHKLNNLHRDIIRERNKNEVVFGLA